MEIKEGTLVIAKGKGYNNQDTFGLVKGPWPKVEPNPEAEPCFEVAITGGTIELLSEKEMVPLVQTFDDVEFPDRAVKNYLPQVLLALREESKTIHPELKTLLSKLNELVERLENKIK